MESVVTEGYAQSCMSMAVSEADQIEATTYISLR
jgi:hypothetical protein